MFKNNNLDNTLVFQLKANIGFLHTDDVGVIKRLLQKINPFYALWKRIDMNNNNNNNNNNKKKKKKKKKMKMKE